MRKLTLLLAVLLLLIAGILPAFAQDDTDDNAVGFNVLAADVEASNGIVHVIDTVLVPPSLEIGAMEEPMDDMGDAEATEEPMDDMGDAEATEEPMDDMADAEATEEPMDEDTTPTIAGIVANSPDHTVLLAAVEAAGLVEALNGDGPFTVFAPTDAAFETALEALGLTAEELLADTDTLTQILGFHVIPGAALTAADLAELSSYETLSGVTVQLGVGEEAVSAGMGDMDMSDAEATEEPTEDIGDAEATEEAMDDMGEAEGTEEPADEGEEATAEEPGTIVDVAVANEFTILVAAVQAADLVETLSGEGPFTVFAPTDEAFEAALEALDLTAEELLADTELLTSVLTYHVVAGEFPAEDVVGLDGEDVETVNGATVAITVDGDTVMVNEATVTAVDVMASNGVIHVIDTVLLPPTDEE